MPCDNPDQQASWKNSLPVNRPCDNEAIKIILADFPLMDISCCTGTLPATYNPNRGCILTDTAGNIILPAPSDPIVLVG